MTIRVWGCTCWVFFWGAYTLLNNATVRAPGYNNQAHDVVMPEPPQGHHFRCTIMLE